MKTVSVEQKGLLKVVGENPGVRTPDLAKALNLTVAEVVNLGFNLVDRGLLAQKIRENKVQRWVEWHPTNQDLLS